MVAIAQLVEHRIVVPSVVGSIPISHPTSLRAFGGYGWQARQAVIRKIFIAKAGVRRSPAVRRA